MQVAGTHSSLLNGEVKPLRLCLLRSEQEALDVAVLLGDVHLDLHLQVYGWKQFRPGDNTVFE